jgi:hypothetical protein
MGVAVHAWRADGRQGESSFEGEGEFSQRSAHVGAAMSPIELVDHSGAASSSPSACVDADVPMDVLSCASAFTDHDDIFGSEVEHESDQVPFDVTDTADLVPVEATETGVVVPMSLEEARLRYQTSLASGGDWQDWEDWEDWDPRSVAAVLLLGSLAEESAAAARY